MTRWINIQEEKPPNHPILVFCEVCKTTHSVLNPTAIGEAELAECCNESGPYFSGETIYFKYWMEQPAPPGIS